MGISDLIALINKANDIAQNVKNLKLNKVLLELQKAVLQYGSQNLELQEKYNELNKYIQNPDDIFIDDDGFICRKNDPNKYCPHCWNKDRRLSLMPKYGIQRYSCDDYSKPYTYECSACKWTVDSSKEHF